MSPYQLILWSVCCIENEGQEHPLCPQTNALFFLLWRCKVRPKEIRAGYTSAPRSELKLHKVHPTTKPPHMRLSTRHKCRDVSSAGLRSPQPTSSGTLRTSSSTGERRPWLRVLSTWVDPQKIKPTNANRRVTLINQFHIGDLAHGTPYTANTAAIIFDCTQKVRNGYKAVQYSVCTIMQKKIFMGHPGSSGLESFFAPFWGPCIQHDRTDEFCFAPSTCRYCMVVFSCRVP